MYILLDRKFVPCPAIVDNYVIIVFFMKHFLYFEVFPYSLRSRITKKFKAFDTYYDMNYSNYMLLTIFKRAEFTTPYQFLLFFTSL